MMLRQKYALITSRDTCRYVSAASILQRADLHGAKNINRRLGTEVKKSKKKAEQRRERQRDRDAFIY